MIRKYSIVSVMRGQSDRLGEGEMQQEMVEDGRATHRGLYTREAGTASGE